MLRAFRQEQQASTEKIGLRAAWRLPHIRRGILVGGVALVMHTTSGAFEGFILHVTILCSLTGIYILALFSTRIFLGVGLTAATAQWAAVGMVAVNVTVTAVATTIVERFGRCVLLFGKKTSIRVLTTNTHCSVGWRMYSFVSILRRFRLY